MFQCNGHGTNSRPDDGKDFVYETVADLRIGSPNAVLVPRPGKSSCAPEPELAMAEDILPPTVADLCMDPRRARPPWVSG